MEDEGANLLENHRRGPGSAECLSGFCECDFHVTPVSMVLCHSLQLSALTWQAENTGSPMVRVLLADINRVERGQMFDIHISAIQFLIIRSRVSS